MDDVLYILKLAAPGWVKEHVQKRCRDEAWIGKRLSPHVVRTFGLNSSGGSPCTLPLAKKSSSYSSSSSSSSSMMRALLRCREDEADVVRGVEEDAPALADALAARWPRACTGLWTRAGSWLTPCLLDLDLETWQAAWR